MRQRLHSDTCLFSLAEWEHMTEHYIKHHDNGAVSLADTVPTAWRWELFHLTDYVVSSITAGTIWLAAR